MAIDLIEQRILELGADKYPRVTQADLDSFIVAEYFINAGEAVGDVPKFEVMNRLTICVLVLKNGFTVTGESACVSPGNYRESIGMEIARKNAKEKLWALLGFKLACELHGVGNA